jgi:hypothetical protein
VDRSSRVNQVNLTVRQVRWSLPVLACDRCSQAAKQVWEASRTAVDIHLDHPVLLEVIVSVHFCPSCRHHFRAQPPFLRPDATYTNRVVAKAVASVHRDHLPFGRVAKRLSRDFWVQPSERMVRIWCRKYTDTLSLEGDYQQWVIAEFSGVLCVDEVYQGKLAMLLAVDSASPEGDRLVGYQLVHGDVQQADVEGFLQRLRRVGIDPTEVVTDASPLYPSVLRQVWPEAAHQLCLFHETRLVVAAVQQVVQEVQASLPKPPAIQRPKGRFRKEPPPTLEGTDELGYDRKTRVALVQRLHREGYSQRAIARRTGHSRMTVGRWLREARVAPMTRPVIRAVPADGAQQANQTLEGEAGVGSPGPGTSTGVNGSAAQRADGDVTEEPEQKAPTAPSVCGEDSTDWLRRPTEPPPPAPWPSWDQVRALRQDLQNARFLLLRRPDHLTEEEQSKVQAVLESPAGEQLRVGRALLVEWYQITRDESGLRRRPEEAEGRWKLWRQRPEYRELAPLRRLLDRMGDEKAAGVLAFLRQEHWEATNNGAERTARQFRHLQASCFRLRTSSAIEGAIKAEAVRVREVLTKPEPQVARASRGRSRGTDNGSGRSREECLAA